MTSTSIGCTTMTSASPSHNPQPTPLLEKGSQLGSNFTGGIFSERMWNIQEWVLKKKKAIFRLLVEKYGTKLQEMERESLYWFYMAVLGVLMITLNLCT